MREHYNRRLAPRARELRNGQTPAERRLWFGVLRAHPVKFRRQVPLLGYVLDFYAPSARLCVELDGTSHDSGEAQAYDAERTRVLEAAGIRVLRFTNAEVQNNLEAVALLIGQAAQSSP